MKELRPIIIIGDGGHARVLLSLINYLSYEIIGVTSKKYAKGHDWNGLPVIGNDEQILLDYTSDEVMLVNGVGSSSNTPTNKRKIFSCWKNRGYTFPSLIHPSAYISEDVEISEGCQVLPNVVVHPNSKIGSNVILNTGAIVEHDNQIGSHTHIAPSVTSCGEVSIGDNCHLGVGSVVIPKVNIGDEAYVAAGSVVTRDIKYKCKVRGVPAKQYDKM